MPLIDIKPKDQATEDMLAALMPQLRAHLKMYVGNVAHTPKEDVIVTLYRCEVRDADPDAADFVIYADTNPGEQIEEAAEAILATIVGTLTMYASLVAHRRIEIWPRFLPGPWCLLDDGKIVDEVKHSIK